MQNRLIELLAAAATAACLATSAGAVTVIDNGDTIVLPGPDDEFVGDIKGTPNMGAGSWSVTFDATKPSTANALVTLSTVVASTFEDLTLSWLDASDNSVIASTAISPIVTALSTSFGPVMGQILRISWSHSGGPLIGFDVTVETSTIPVPLGGVLLLSALGGLGYLGRRRMAA